MRFNFKVKSAQPHLPEQQYVFYIAKVNWSSVHPERYSHEVVVEIWYNSFDLFGLSCFILVQRIKSNCSLGKTITNKMFLEEQVRPTEGCIPLFFYYEFKNYCRASYKNAMLK